MNKDEILKMSREENKGRHDEREMIAYGTASKVGMLVGALVCGICKRVAFSYSGNRTGWPARIFCMQAISNIVLFKNLKKRRNLI